MSFFVIASKSGEQTQDGVYRLAVRVTAPFRLTNTVRNRGREQLASVSTAAMISGRVAFRINKSLVRVGEVRGVQKRPCVAGCSWGPLGTLLLLDTVTCAAVAFFLPLPPFLVTCAQVCSWGCGGSETVNTGKGPV